MERDILKTLDLHGGTTGNVYGEAIETVEPLKSLDTSGTFMAWADEIRALKVRTNADTPHDAETAVKFGAEGIGLYGS